MPDTDPVRQRQSPSTLRSPRLAWTLLLVGLVLYGYGVLARLNALASVPRGDLFGGSVTAALTAVGALYLAVGAVVSAWCWSRECRLSPEQTAVIAGVSTLLATGMIALLFREVGWLFAAFAVLSAQLVVGAGLSTARRRWVALFVEAVAVAAAAGGVLLATRDVIPPASLAVVCGLAAVAFLVLGAPVSQLGRSVAAA